MSVVSEAMTWPGTWAGIIGFAIAVPILGFGLTYFVVLQVLGLRAIRNERRAVPQRTDTHWDLFFLLACLNEESVIGATVDNLIASAPQGHIVVVDDGSADATAARARSAGGAAVTIVSRMLPEARLGKGFALNHGLRTIEDYVREHDLDPDRVLVCVMDADGRLSPGTVPAVLRLFAEPRVGGTQLPVRIRNRHRLLTRIQDIGFWGSAVPAQAGRHTVGTVSLGGNGQFTRLSALRSVGARPWSQSLTEDLDLTISLAVAGWRTAMTAQAWVEQEGPESLRTLLRQRTRWAQGHMVCAGRIGELWRARRLTNLGFLELTAYLLQPWLAALPWSILAPFLVFWAAWMLVMIATALGWATALAFAGAAYLLAFGPQLYAAVVYSRRAGDMNLIRSLWWQVAGLALTGITYLATWRALVRIVRGRTGWDKTARVAQGPSVVPAGEPTGTTPASPRSPSPRPR